MGTSSTTSGAGSVAGRGGFHGRFRIVLATLALAVAPLLAACGVTPGAVTATDTVSRSVTVPAGPTIDVHTFNGSISIVPGSDGTVAAQVTRTGQGASKDEALADAQKIAVSLTVQGSTATLTATYTPSPDRVTGSRGAAAVVTVPAGSTVKLATSNGTISVRGVSGLVTAATTNGRVTVDDAAAAVAIESTNGPVTVHGQATGVRVRTTNGGITVGGPAGVVDLQTTNGAIEVTAAREAAVTTQTSNGRITFGGTLASGVASFRNSNGPVSISLPSAAAFELNASTSNGKVHTEFPITLTGAASDHELHGTVGSSPAVHITASPSNGDVSITRSN